MPLSSRISSLTGPDRAVDDKQFLLLAGALSVLLKEIVGAARNDLLARIDAYLERQP